MSLIEFDRVMKQYVGEIKPAVNAVSLQIEKGEFVCLIGASGCGKTTTIKLIAGLEEPTTGRITKPANVAMAFQFGALFPWLSVYENVALGLRERGESETAIASIVGAQLKTMGIAEYAQKYPADLSGGQRQRVGIARALAVDPAVLLLDEPFSALDPKTTAELHDDLVKVWQSTHKTIVMVSHVIEEAVSLAGRVMLMKEGTIAHTFTVDLPYPRRESEHFHREVMKIRHDFFV